MLILIDDVFADAATPLMMMPPLFSDTMRHAMLLRRRLR